jgi:hypothetical protein
LSFGLALDEWIAQPLLAGGRAAGYTERAQGADALLAKQTGYLWNLIRNPRKLSSTPVLVAIHRPHCALCRLRSTAFPPCLLQRP